MIKKLLKKLNNFRTMSIVASAIEAFAILTSILFLICYTFAGEFDGRTQITAFAYQKGNPTPQYLGMVFFLSCLFSIILGVFVIYKLFPTILNKDKITPSRVFLITGACNAVFHLVLSVLTVVLLATEQPKTLVGFIIALLMSLISTVACALLVYPIVKCDFYMPEIKK